MSRIECYASLPLGQPYILLLGRSGQLGLALNQLIDKKALLLPERADIDFMYPERLPDLVLKFRPAVIINAAAYTQVDEAQIRPELAYTVNTQAVAVLAQAAKRIGALLVHCSTDYVFDGSGDQPWREKDKPAPLNVYGVSKRGGEQAIMASGCRHLIFRTSWLHSPYRQNFLKTMLGLGQERTSITVVCDQIGAPTSAAMLAEVILGAIKQTLANPALCGLYHVTAKGETSWYDYARLIFTEANKMGVSLKVIELKAVLSQAYPSAARRPLNSRLDTTKFCSAFGLELPHWREGVEETLRQLLKAK
ncbi:dTDP-4-dehydrorhamnose reductase [Aeromonas taiwanensis]|uniref:dTDP-4-dehydrorhamnose reductase n=1 Tax=Aeromonas taiwanensis TaxID=633417 RepID=UPI003B9E837C